MSQISIELDVAVPMRDGTVLRADVYRPLGEGPFPVLVSRGPYGKMLTSNVSLDTLLMVQAGYIVVHQDTRGRFSSEGEWMPWKYEREDGYDTVEWAAALQGSNGQVAALGASYMGSATFSSAIAGAPSLRTIVPAVTWSDPRNGTFFRGGAIEHGLNVQWSLLTAATQAPKAGLDLETIGQIFADFDQLSTCTYWQLPSGDLPALSGSGLPSFGVERALEDYSSTSVMDVTQSYDAVTVPSLLLAGWYDVFQQGTLDNFVELRRRGLTARLVVGPWSHSTYNNAWVGGQVGQVNFGFAAASVSGQSITDVQREWFDHWLKGEPATSAHESGVLVFVMGANVWREEREWPPARAVDTVLHLHAGESLRWDGPAEDHAGTEFDYDPADPVITCGGNLVMPTDFPAGPWDQRDVESRDDVLVFTTDALDHDIEITGHVYAKLFVSTDGPSTDWVVRLCDVDERGVSRNIVDGIKRVHTEPGRVDEVDVDLWSTSIVIKQGHRLRVQVTSSNFPRWDRNLNTGEPEASGSTMRTAHNKVLHDRQHLSRVILPVISS